MNLLKKLTEFRNRGIMLRADATGDTIRISGNASSLDINDRVFLKENKQQIIRLLLNASAKPVKTLGRIDSDGFYPISYAQRNIWLLSRNEKANAAYNIPFSYNLAGNVNVLALQNALARLSDRHEILRTTFSADNNGDIAQFISLTSCITLNVVDLSTSEEADSDIHDRLKAETAHPFDLEKGPLLRCTLYQLAGGRGVLNFVVHHIIADGWSISVIIEELLAFYDAVIHEKAQPFEPLEFQYKDYAVWQTENEPNSNGLADDDGWLDQFSGDLPQLNLMYDHPRLKDRTYMGGRVLGGLDARTVSSLKRACQEEGTTLFAGLVSVLSVLLNRYTGQSDIIMGTVVAGRSQQQFMRQIGMYVNTLPIRVRFEPMDSYRKLLRNVKTVTEDTFDHQNYPFDRLIEELDIRFERGRNPLFDVMIILNNNLEADRKRQFELDGLDISEYSAPENQTSKFDLTFSFLETGEIIEFSVNYNKDIFEHETACRFADHYCKLLECCLQDEQVPLSRLDYLSASEKQQLLTGFNAESTEEDANLTVMDMFAQHVATSPDQVAVYFGGRSLTYRELDAQAIQLGHYLREVHGIGAGDLVGVSLERSEMLIVCILAVLKTGGAYVPIDPAYPAERKSYMISDSGCRLVLDAEWLAGSERARAAYPVSGLSSVAGPQDLAYVIYTSGSTGKPKGVMIEHHSLSNYIAGQSREFAFQADENILQVSNISFDASAEQIFLALTNGARLTMIPMEVLMDFDLLKQVIVNQNITHLHATPGILSGIDTAGIKSLRRVVSAGDICTSTVVQKWASAFTLYNKYGPTEATISAIQGICNLENKSVSIPIGRPLANTAVYILDGELGLNAVGVAGQICLGGAGLARGYLNNAALTSEKFVSNPYRAGELLYLTGDVGRWLSDGSVEFIGRQDDQVKVRGHRIEPGEIGRTLEMHVGIRSSVVVAHTDGQGEQYLVAYYEGDGGLAGSELQSWLGTQLPSYMVPAHYVHLPTLPLTVNGKVDRGALPLPASLQAESGGYVAPVTDMEKRLARLWCEVLGREQVGLTDDFFELGGHSLRATRLASQIHKVFEVKVDLRELLQSPSFAGQVKLIESGMHTSFALIPVASEASGYVLSSSQRRLWVLSQFSDGNVAYNMPGVYVFEGDLDVAGLGWSLEQVVRRHQVLRTVFGQDSSGEVQQYILDYEQSGFGLSYIDLRSDPEQSVSLEGYIRSEFMEAFDLVHGPLLRACVYELGGGKWVFTYTMHHIIRDEWSMELLIKQVLDNYNNYVSGRRDGDGLAPLRIQYKDYAVWQQSRLSGGQESVHRSYWLQQLGGRLPVLDLPSGRVRPAVKTYNGGVVSLRLGADMVQGLRRLAHQNGCTLFMGLLAGINGLLYRYTGHEDMVIGSPIAGRGHADLEDQIGFYVNTLALRSRFSGEDSYEQLLMHVRQVTLDAYEHQSYPFDALVDDLDLHRDMSRNPLFDIQVILKTPTGPAAGLQPLSGLEVRAYEGLEKPTSVFDMVFNFAEQGDTLELNIVYNTDIYDAAFVGSLSGHVERFFGSVVAAPDQRLSSLRYLSDAEIAQQLDGFSGAVKRHGDAGTVLDLMGLQGWSTLDQVALESGGDSLSYASLWAHSSALSRYLLEDCGLVRGELVGVLLDRSAYSVISMLGILGSGGVYVPIDPEYPLERRQYLMQDMGIRQLITQTDYLFDLGGYSGHVFAIDVQLDGLPVPALSPFVGLSPQDAAYVVYTSGSSGKPKGVLVGHGALLNSIAGQRDVLDLPCGERLLQFFSMSFDVSVFEVMLSLVSGGTLYMIDEASRRDVGALEQYLTGHKIGVATLPASYLKLLDLGRLPFLQRLITGGESVSYDSLRAQPAGLRYYNAYGPSEFAICATMFRVESGPSFAGGRIPIGRPLANTAVYILDGELGLNAVGVAGQICLGGAGLARGYLNNAALTSEKFVSNPYRAGELLYLTGDVGRWLSDGSVEFIGRQDDQVKVRGHRIEPGEIGRTLEMHVGIRSSVVVAHTDGQGEQYLVAYYEGDGGLAGSELQSWLGTQLPSYMVPAHYVHLPTLPLTVNGKVDRGALPLPASLQAESGGYVAPVTDMEKRLARLWCEVLGREQVGLTDDFFELGGHSLRATRLASQIHKVFEVKVDLRELLQSPSFAGQVKLIESGMHTSFALIPVASEASGYVLSSSQRRLWVLSQFSDGNVAYNMPGVYVFEGDLDVAGLGWSLEQVVRRHQVLRTVFGQDSSGEVQQYILDYEQSGFGLSYIDLRSDPEQSVSLEGYIRSEFMGAFDLVHGPLLRACVYELGGGKWVFTYTMHHIVGDGWSMNLLIKQVLDNYNNYINGRRDGDGLAPLRIQYKDYAVWQQSRLSGGQESVHRSYWLQQLGGRLPVLDLATDHVRPAVKTYNGGVVSLRLGADMVQGLRRLAHQNGCTLFMGLLAGINGLLYRYTGHEDMVIGSPIAGRGHADLEDQIGFYVNTLALRSRFSGEDSYEQLLMHVRQVTLDAYEHQSYPFDALVDDLDLHRDMSRSALFDVMVVLQNTERDFTQGVLQQVSVSRYGQVEQSVSKFDLIFTFVEQEDALSVSLQYNSDLYERETAGRLLGHAEGFLRAAVTSPEEPLSRLDYLPAAERVQLLTGFNATAVAYDTSLTVVDMFERQVASTPGRVAVCFGGRSLTYRELDGQATQLGHYLREVYGIGADDLVGISLERSEMLIVCILGVLKAGGAYVPIDPAYPAERKSYMVTDSGCRLVLDAEWLAGSERARAAYPVDGLSSVAGPENLVYVIYTSGSTGKPKGVMMTHQSSMNLMNFHTREFADCNVRSVLQFASTSFDVSFQEIFFCLLNGATLFPISDDIKSNVATLSEFVVKNDIQIAFFPTSFFKVLSESDFLSDAALTLDHIIVAGEQLILSQTFIDLLSETNVTLHNHYGPAETHVVTTCQIAAHTSIDLKRVPSIGKPISNVQIYILDRSSNIVPVGVAGEIYIGGAALSLGYWNSKDRTQQKFVQNPFDEGQILYKTGDLGKWFADGRIEFVGRIDNQVKIRGYRIEPGEVENALLSHNDIDFVFVDIREINEEPELIAYIESDTALNAAEIKRFLNAQIPAYMIPQHYVIVPEIPLTTNGKIDRVALKTLGVNSESLAEIVLPRNDIETRLLRIWQEILSVDMLGVTDNFFDLGGHSIKVTRLLMQIKKEFDIDMDIKEVFLDPTIEILAEKIGNRIWLKHSEPVDDQYSEISI